MRKRVLIVNDSHAVLHTLALVLRRAGYEVALASRPETALAKAPQADVMLCDSVVREDKHGSIARRALRRNKGLRVLLWVGGGEQPLDFIKRHLSNFWTLPKPIDPPLLLEHLGRATLESGR
jgi:DNA-binding NtrC family response regulator